MKAHFFLAATAFLAPGLVGCQERPTLIPNSDPALRQTSNAFSADAANRVYPGTAPKGTDLPSRASVDYMLDSVQVANLGGDAWQGAEVWVDQKYVVYIPGDVQPGSSRTLPFTMLFDDRGNHLPTHTNTSNVTQVQVFVNGKLYDVPIALAD